MNVESAINNLKQRFLALDKVKLEPQEVVTELLFHIMSLEEICLQQQRDIVFLHRKINTLV